MKIKTFTFFRHKTYLLSFLLIISVGIFASLPAYSQIDYNYGVSKKGFRLSLGAGAAGLVSNWGTSTIGPVGTLGLDYDLSQFFSIGLQGATGQTGGTDSNNKLYFKKTSLVFGSGSLGFKVAVGQFANFETSNAFEDALKRIYVGAGIGAVYSNVTLTPHYDGKGLPALDIPGLVAGKTMIGVKQTSKGTFTGNASFAEVPVNCGINIALRGFGGNDKLELNPNFQYNFVQSPLFDGYQPNSQIQPANPTIKKNGNQAFYIASIALRLKF